MLLPVWDDVYAVEPDANEATVEQRVIQPLLVHLGYETTDIEAKRPIWFQRGTRGRKHEADFVVYCGQPHNPSTSAMVIEAKRPGEDMEDARDQAISYARVVGAPFVFICDGFQCQLWHLPYKTDSEIELSCSFALSDLGHQFAALEQCVGKPAALEYARNARLKWALPAPRQYATYVDAELRRTGRYSAVIDRQVARLSTEAGGGTAGGDEILNEVAGAVIVARSGMGKTSLGMRLFRLALAQHGETKGEVVPFHINLPEVGGRTLIDFALEQSALITRRPHVS